MAGDAMRHENDIPMPTQRWMGEKRSNIRQAWHQYLDGLTFGIEYNDLDTSAEYVVKLFSQRSSPLVIDGIKAKLTKTGEKYDKVTEQIFTVHAGSQQGRTYHADLGSHTRRSQHELARQTLRHRHLGHEEDSS